MSSPEIIKNSLCRCISEFVSNPQNCLRDPKRDFKRHRKLPLEKMIYSILHFGNETLSNELLDISQFSVDMPTVSAFVQQRKKLLPTAFESIFHSFTKRTRQTQLYKGMRLYAVDGSDLQISTNPKDLESFYPSVNGAKPYNLLHLNALYDLLSKTYVDASIQKGRRVNEHQAFVDIIDRLEDFFPILILADRGYESYNNLAHLQEKGFFFLIRVKDATSKNGIAPGFSLPDESFDRQFHLSLTRKQTNETKQLFRDKENFRFIPSTSVFDFLPQKNKKKEPTLFYQLHFRLVRFPLSENSYETIITNANRQICITCIIQQPESGVIVLLPHRMEHIGDVKREQDRLFLALQVLHPLRLEEVLGLRWEDIDFNNKLLYIRRAVTHPKRNQPEVKEPKTEKSKRTIGLSTTATDYLSLATNKTGFVVGGDTHLSYTKVRRMCERIQKDIQFDGKITPLRFRTTVLTDLYDQTKDIKLTQNTAGHATSTMTLKHYVKGRSSVNSSAQVIDDLYSS